MHLGIFGKCNLGKAIRNRLFDFPPPSELPETDTIAPYVVLGDEAFPLLPNLLKPYSRDQSVIDRSKAIFNYRLSRARRIVENAFGILTQRFRIFSTPIFLNIDTTEDLITSACIIHNMIADEKAKGTRINEEINETSPSDMDSFIENDIQEPASVEPKLIRDSFKNYFNGTGAVSWQNDTFRL